LGDIRFPWESTRICSCGHASQCLQRRYPYWWEVSPLGIAASHTARSAASSASASHASGLLIDQKHDRGRKVHDAQASRGGTALGRDEHALARGNGGRRNVLRSLTHPFSDKISEPLRCGVCHGFCNFDDSPEKGSARPTQELAEPARWSLICRFSPPGAAVRGFFLGLALVWGLTVP